jgi:hypothetical protein
MGSCPRIFSGLYSINDFTTNNWRHYIWNSFNCGHYRPYLYGLETWNWRWYRLMLFTWLNKTPSLLIQACAS